MSSSRRDAGRPAFLITIDTEGDNLWSKPREITTRNSGYLPRFQALGERYGFKPTYLTNWEMIQCTVFEEFARDVIRRNTGEIGMHLQSWNSPPLVALTDDDFRHQPYLIEYPAAQIREKVRILTDTLEDRLQVKMRSHRAGRWSFNATYAQVLIEHGYHVDCSVVPHTSYAQHIGDPHGRGGTDYTQFPEEAYFLDGADISRPGTSSLLEIPVTVVPNQLSAPMRWAQRGLELLPGGQRVARRLIPRHLWLRPNGSNLRWMKRAIDLRAEAGHDYVEFMLHSSEFMPGGSPTFPSAASIESLYADMEQVFAYASARFTGLTLDEYYEAHVERLASVA